MTLRKLAEFECTGDAEMSWFQALFAGNTWQPASIVTLPVGVGVGVAVGETGVFVGGTGVPVGVLVAGMGVFVAATDVFVGGTGVLVGPMGVFVGVCAVEGRHSAMIVFESTREVVSLSPVQVTRRVSLPCSVVSVLLAIAPKRPTAANAAPNVTPGNHRVFMLAPPAQVIT